MRLLLDTHPLLWLATRNPRLSPTAYEACVDPANDVLCSVASQWEIAIKCSLGKLKLPVALDDFLAAAAQADLLTLNIQRQHLLTLSSLPFHHRDPFDRLLIAQAECEDAALVTADPNFVAYGVRVFW
jgi:PIN domain nuclease of toxin-antitoxin system